MLFGPSKSNGDGVRVPSVELSGQEFDDGDGEDVRRFLLFKDRFTVKPSLAALLDNFAFNFVTRYSTMFWHTSAEQSHEQYFEFLFLEDENGVLLSAG